MIVHHQVTELAFFRISCRGGILSFHFVSISLTGELQKRAPADVGVLAYLPHSDRKSACVPHSSVSLGPTPGWTQFWLCYVWTTIQTLLLVRTPELCVYSSSSAVRLLMSHCVGSQCGSTWWLCSLLTKTTANLNPFVLNDLCFGLSIFLVFSSMVSLPKTMTAARLFFVCFKVPLKQLAFGTCFYKDLCESLLVKRGIDSVV